MLCLLYICSIFKGIRNPSFTDNESWIQNRRLSWITFITWLESYVWTNMFPWNSRRNVWIGISFCLYFWSQFHFELLYALQKVGMLIYSWPVPVEWSPEGPVNGLLVDPVLLLHWNSAFGSCSYPHRPPSKSQVPDAANKHLFIYLFVFLFIYLYVFSKASVGVII